LHKHLASLWIGDQFCPHAATKRGRLAAVWDSEVVPLLKSVSGLRPVAIFDEIRRRHPEIGAGVRRTLERRIRAWRALNGAEQDVIFRQEHPPGRLGLSDFTDMGDHRVSIAGVPLDLRASPTENRSIGAGRCHSGSLAASYRGCSGLAEH
jgi:hypothetical protein